MTEFGKTPEFEFKDGALYISSPLLKMRLMFKPEPRAEEQDVRGRWKPAWPEFRVLARGGCRLKAKQKSSKDKREAFELFRRTVPSSLRKIVEPFDSHQWMFLRFIAISDSARELAESNPVLAYTLANSYEFRRTMPDAAFLQALAHSRNKQKDLCGWLGFLDNLAMVRIFKKIQPESVSPSRMRCLRNALRRDEEQVMKLLRHRKVINGSTLDLVEMPKVLKLITPKLFDDVEQAGGDDVSSIAVDQLFHALDVLKQIGSRREVRPFQSIRQIEDFVEAVDHEYMEHQQHLRQRLAALRRAEQERITALAAIVSKRTRVDPRDFAWPAPPIPGTDTIIPITSYDMIAKESSQQSNCIKSYWKSIVSNNSRTYAYRMVKPQRATFTIVRRAAGVWHLSEIKGPNNRRVSATTRRVVQDWLYENSISATLPGTG